MPRILMVGPDELASAAAVRAYAERHRIGLAALRRRDEAGGPAIGDDPRRVCTFPFGYRAVFSLEEHPAIGRPGGVWIRHLSVGVLGGSPGALPSIAAVLGIMPLFGMAPDLAGCAVYTEDCDGVPVAINVQQPEEPRS